MLCTVFVTVGAIISLKLEAKEDRVASDLPEPGLAAFWGVFTIGVMVIVYPWAQITSTAFKKAGPLHGCLCLTLVYCPAIAIGYWGELKRPFFMWIFGFILLVGSYGTYYYYTGEMPESLI